MIEVIDSKINAVEVVIDNSNNIKDVLLEDINNFEIVKTPEDCKSDSDFQEKIVRNINAYFWRFIKDNESVIRSSDCIDTLKIKFMVFNETVFCSFTFRKYYNDNSDYDWVSSAVCASTQYMETYSNWGQESTYGDPTDNVELDVCFGKETSRVKLEDISYTTYLT